MKTIFGYLWKIPLCGIGFFIGMAVSGGVLPALGFTAPEMPAGTDQNTIVLWFLLGSLVLAAVLSLLARQLNLHGLARWLWLSLLTWGAAAVGMVLEAWFFMDTGAVSSSSSAVFTMLNFVLPSLCVSGMAVVLFRPAAPVVRGETGLAKFFRQHSLGGWTWRILAAWLAYPAAYFTFGLLVLPFIETYYAAGQYELAAPTWGQLIPLQLTRSALFLLITLPVLVNHRGSRRVLVLVLGANLFIMTAFMATLTSYWFSWQLRLFHSLELLADALVYVGALVGLFRAPGYPVEKFAVQTASLEKHLAAAGVVRAK